jgi:hypothetical protein
MNWTDREGTLLAMLSLGMAVIFVTAIYSRW